MDRSNFMSQTSAGRLFSYISEPGSVIDLSREIVHLRVCIRLRGQEGLCVKLDENQLWAESQWLKVNFELKVNDWKSTVNWKSTAESQQLKVNCELEANSWKSTVDESQLWAEDKWGISLRVDFTLGLGTAWEVKSKRLTFNFWETVSEKKLRLRCWCWCWWWRKRWW